MAEARRRSRRYGRRRRDARPRFSAAAAEKNLSVLSLADLQEGDGVQKIFDILDSAYPEQPRPQKLAQARSEVMDFEWNWDETTEKEINRYRRTLQQGEKYKVSFSEENKGLMLFEQIGYDLKEQANVRGASAKYEGKTGNGTFETYTSAILELYPLFGPRGQQTIRSG